MHNYTIRSTPPHFSLFFLMRPWHESVAKETASSNNRVIHFKKQMVSSLKSGEISLIEAGNEANNGLLASFLTKSSGIYSANNTSPFGSAKAVVSRCSAQPFLLVT